MTAARGVDMAIVVVYVVLVSVSKLIQLHHNKKKKTNKNKNKGAHNANEFETNVFSCTVRRVAHDEKRFQPTDADRRLVGLLGVVNDDAQ